MAKVTLTDRAINRKPPASGILELWDTVVPGLALRISYGGTRTFTVTTRVNGRQVRRKIGTTLTHKLTEARAAAREILADAGRGIDSMSSRARKQAIERERQEAERADASTFEAVAEAWLTDTGKGGAGNNRSVPAVKARLRSDVFPKIGALPIEAITRADVRSLVDGIAKDRPIAANRALATIRRVFAWAIMKDLVDASPVVGIEPPAEERSRERVLIDDEIARLWSALGATSYPFGPLFRLLLLTGQRRSEVAGMRWSEIDDDTWRLPGERTKNGRPHLVPLSSAAKEVLDAIPRIDGSDFVFTSGRARTRDTNGRRVVDRPVSGFGRAKELVDKTIAAAGDPLSHWTLHDIRRSVVTGMNETLGIEPHVIEAVVNHVSGAATAGVAGVYNRAQYLPQRRAALEAWGAHVLTLAGGKPADNVVKLHG